MNKQTKTMSFFHIETNIRKPYTIYAIVGCGGVHSYSFYSVWIS